MWALCLGALVIISFTHWVYRWRNPRCNGKLPPGSMGLPLLGETIQFFSPNTSSDIPPYVKERMKRYGPIFRTNLVGRPVVASTDPDLNYFIFQQRDSCFRAGIQRRSQKSLDVKILKKMLPEVQQAASKRLQLWSHQDTIELKEATASQKLISYDKENSSENLRDNFVAFMQGLISFPLEMPGTAYHKYLQGRKRAMKMLKNLLHERRANLIKHQSDIFYFVLEELQNEGSILTEAIALDLMFVLLFASFETTSIAITMAVKFLSDHPLVLNKLMEEHEAILKIRENADSSIKWKEYKSMTFTFQFINETVRLANIVPVIFRKALREIQFKGYTIPAGWAIMVCPPAVHLYREKYEDPLAFNPWRWEGQNITGASKHFMAFGGGMRFCVGAEITKVQMAVFLHCLVTKYRWQAIKGGNIVQTPGLQFPNGYHIKIIENETRFNST
ncbi:hypothetical protein GH714_002494 [Hevea brasiliensis]|uniref:Cytochrome P450 n=1 Tax=Hevea brasiliensis TaxID=3981 RepID=A0A6A6LB03_HEVBR|nr:hypothetical protein GH714_002494 [Hevea brasiliensis]